MASDEIRKSDLVSLLNYRYNGKPVRGVEIGVLHGDLSQYLLEHYPFTHLYSIDPYFNETNEELRYCEVFNRMKPWILQNQYTLIRAGSQNIYSFFDDNSLDFVFIDGDHSYEGTLADLVNYTPKVIDGGLVIAHDWRSNVFPGIIKAGMEFLSNNSNLFEPLMTNEQLTQAGLNFKQGGYNGEACFIHKQQNAVWPMWWRLKKFK